MPFLYAGPTCLVLHTVLLHLACLIVGSMFSLSRNTDATKGVGSITRAFFRNLCHISSSRL